ncbi:MAG TPA: HU family DNA-binding protein [Acidimicrobiales bacterium]|nr:HU family DNA-binding protein [Acidimicrobiales bacterium]
MSKNYTKSELLSEVAEKAGVAKSEAEQVLGAFFEKVTEAVKGDRKVSWPGFGSFSKTHRAARTGRNPQTGDPVEIKASDAMKFTASKALKEEMNS